jgi:hypothetical protein
VQTQRRISPGTLEETGIVNLRKPLGTSVGVVALTVVAAASALAVNAGILRSHSESSVGTLDTTATSVVADPPAQRDVQYVTVYVDDPAPATVAPADSSIAQVVSPTPATTVAPQPAAGSYGDDAYEHEYEGAEADD